MRIVLAMLCLVGAGLSGLIWSAARSDFTFRGCPDVPRESWEATVNCSDAWFAMSLFGTLALGLTALTGLMIRRHLA